MQDLIAAIQFAMPQNMVERAQTRDCQHAKSFHLIKTDEPHEFKKIQLTDSWSNLNLHVGQLRGQRCHGGGVDWFGTV